jgi:hypothetical protein
MNSTTSGVVIARVLGYKNARDTVNKKVDASYKKSYSELMTNGRMQNADADSSQSTSDQVMPYF